jgi:hypothetical protein
LLLGLLQGLRRVLLGPEVLKSQKEDDREEREGDEAAGVTTAAAAATAGSLRFQIWVFEFGQRRLPVVEDEARVKAPLCLW